MHPAMTEKLLTGIKSINTNMSKARIFLLVDLREFFSDLPLGGEKKNNKKALKMTS